MICNVINGCCQQSDIDVLGIPQICHIICISCVQYRFLGVIILYPVFIWICFKFKNLDKVIGYIFSYVRQTSTRSDDKLVVVEAQMLLNAYFWKSRFHLMYW